MSYEVDFICGCPTLGCANANSCIKWTHHNCGGYQTINKKGFVKCKSCPMDCPIVLLEFKCGEHQDFRPFNLQAAFRALAMLSNLPGVNDDWIEELCDEVRKLRKKYKS